MVTPVHPVPFTGATPQSGMSAQQTSRSIAEARRLLLENHITGAKASRIMAMLVTAEQYIGNGKSTDAQRLAREALKQVKETAEIENPADPNKENKEEVQLAPPDSENEETPVGDALDQDGSNVFQRETTTYQDGSSDSGISFQSPTPFTPAQAPFAVRQHELSHVRRETSDALLEGRRVMTSVTIHSTIDPRTGERHVGGGQARVIVFPKLVSNVSTGQNLNVKA
ncbi:MAG: hypothetical protein C4527_16110 [Candidatus Omnitrophota bacterium]|jgi:hypothetical protein|nr:MAG: hypothetical protein C4527_16110 [Candidatus Omnitrophota bacterium]